MCIDRFDTRPIYSRQMSFYLKMYLLGIVFLLYQTRAQQNDYLNGQVTYYFLNSFNFLAKFGPKRQLLLRWPEKPARIRVPLWWQLRLEAITAQTDDPVTLKSQGTVGNKMKGISSFLLILKVEHLALFVRDEFRLSFSKCWKHSRN